MEWYHNHLSDEMVEFVERQLDGTRSGFFIVSLPIPDGYSPVFCHLHGPSVGDAPVPESEVHYEARNGREGPSRLCNRPGRPATSLVVIGSGDTVFTAYGTLCATVAPREPWDSSLSPEEKEESTRFWDSHALSVDGK